MELSAYFQILQYILMGATAVAIALIFLYVYHNSKEDGTEEKEENQ
jgi:isopentenyl diphosphate isomerase/L-lactate dehydrogenase-like FMN-dependent dehydrogenase